VPIDRGDETEPGFRWGGCDAFSVDDVVVRAAPPQTHKRPRTAAPSAVRWWEVPPPRDASQDEFDRFRRRMYAIKRMHPLERTATSTLVSPSAGARLVAAMAGMDKIAALLSAVIVGPSVAPDTYAATVGKLSGLHFCLIGPRGSGRHEATASVCASCCVDMVTVSPYQYTLGDVGFALEYACKEMPCVVYFDGFETLWRKERFVEEFSYEVLGMEGLRDSWDGVWLAFAVESSDPVMDETMPIRDLCGFRRCASVSDLTDKQRRDLMFDRFLCAGGAEVRSDAAGGGDAAGITDRQWSDLKMAMRDCAPGDLRRFAADVQYSALSRVPIQSLSDQERESGQRRPLQVSWEQDGVTSYVEDRQGSDKSGKRKLVVARRSASSSL